MKWTTSIENLWIEANQIYLTRIWILKNSNRNIKDQKRITEWLNFHLVRLEFNLIDYCYTRKWKVISMQAEKRLMDYWSLVRIASNGTRICNYNLILVRLHLHFISFDLVLVRNKYRQTTIPLQHHLSHDYINNIDKWLMVVIQQIIHRSKCIIHIFIRHIFVWDFWLTVKNTEMNTLLIICWVLCL